MDLLQEFVGFVLHVDVHLASIIAQYGGWTYAILFLIIFCETGLVVTPFLPGDSLLFATGALAVNTALDVRVLFVLLFVAAVVGDAVNYWIGAKVGPKLFDGRIPYLRQAHLDRTHAFYEKYGGKTIVIARFVPIVRTVAPFVAGAGSMSYGRFALFNVAGGALWVGSMLLGGFFFGNIPLVRENFGLVVIAIIVLSLIPPIVELIRPRPVAGGQEVP
ncbi:MAG: DedA family protein [Gemmatimonadaceae bacterium]